MRPWTDFLQKKIGEDELKEAERQPNFGCAAR